LRKLAAKHYRVAPGDALDGQGLRIDVLAEILAAAGATKMAGVVAHDALIVGLSHRINCEIKKPCDRRLVLWSFVATAAPVMGRRTYDKRAGRDQDEFHTDRVGNLLRQRPARLHDASGLECEDGRGRGRRRRITGRRL